MDALPDARMALLDQRVQQLTQAFRHIAATRMQGLPLLNQALQVEAIGFEAVAGVDADGTATLAGVGILLTPWFMNLIWLPLHGGEVLAVGDTRVHRIGMTDFVFIGANDERAGAYEMCSLFSPMFEFRDQLAARETGQQALALVRRTDIAEPVVAPDTSSRPNTRRAFLFGRSARQS
jgi:[NiFe] hydrogenase assembly HybE family chaperone